MLLQLHRESMQTIQTVLDVLQLCSLDAHKLGLGPRIVQDHSASHVFNINRPVKLPWRGLDLFKNQRQKFLHERLECLLQSLADSLRCREAILDDGVILTLLGLRRSNQHRVQDRYGILVKALLGHGVGQQREALKALPEQLSLLSVVGGQRNHLCQRWDQHIVVLAEPLLGQPSNHSNCSDGTTHHRSAAILMRRGQHCVELVHQWINPGLHVHFVHLLCEMSKRFHTMNGNTGRGVLEPLQKQRQHLGVEFFHEPGLVVFRDSSHRGPRSEPEPRVLRCFNHPHHDSHTLADVVCIFQVLHRLLNCGQGSVLALPSGGRQARLNVAQDDLENDLLILNGLGDTVQHFATIIVQLLFIIVILVQIVRPGGFILQLHDELHCAVHDLLQEVGLGAAHLGLPFTKGNDHLNSSLPCVFTHRVGSTDLEHGTEEHRETRLEKQRLSIRVGHFLKLLQTFQRVVLILRDHLSRNLNNCGSNPLQLLPPLLGVTHQAANQLDSVHAHLRGCLALQDHSQHVGQPALQVSIGENAFTQLSCKLAEHVQANARTVGVSAC
mmetsp:Transcript_20915/g.45989  ORF Transcript_20915/g.45989 Transcript_20915/m.45989 type:complete len:554 (-) Transcript_20915:533-2194(-)